MKALWSLLAVALAGCVTANSSEVQIPPDAGVTTRPYPNAAHIRATAICCATLCTGLGSSSLRRNLFMGCGFFARTT